MKFFSKQSLELRISPQAHFWLGVPYNVVVLAAVLAALSVAQDRRTTVMQIDDKTIDS